MNILFNYSGESVGVTWNEGSRGWYAQHDLETEEKWTDSVEVTCVFSKVNWDAKEHELHVAGKLLTKIKLRRASPGEPVARSPIRPLY